MPDLMTVAMMIVISSITLAALVAYLGKDFWNEGCQQLTLALLLFGISFTCMTGLAAPARTTLFLVAYVTFGCALSACIWALHRFYQRPVHPWWLLALPLSTAAAYVLLLDLPPWRIRAVSSLFFVANLWLLHGLLGRRLQPRSKGEWMFLLGVLLVSSGMLLRIVYPNASLSMRSANDGTRAILLSFANLFIALHLKAVGFLLMARDRADVQLQRFASEDSLTGLANRRTVLEALHHAVQRHRPQHDSLSVLLIDIDHFKRINDVCGHPAGDRVLEALGHILQAPQRPQTVAGRYGGEEFMLVCPATTAAEAFQLATRLCDAVRSTVSARHQAEQWPVTLSIGISTWAPPENAGDSPRRETLDSLLRQADLAMYQAKHAGRDRVCLYVPEQALAQNVLA